MKSKHVIKLGSRHFAVLGSLLNSFHETNCVISELKRGNNNRGFNQKMSSQNHPEHYDSMDRSTQAAVRLARIEKSYDVVQLMRRDSGLRVPEAWQPSRLDKEKWAHKMNLWVPAPHYCERFITGNRDEYKPAGQRREFLKLTPPPSPAKESKRDLFSPPPVTLAAIQADHKLEAHFSSLSEPEPLSLSLSEADSLPESADWGGRVTPPGRFEDDDDADCGVTPCLAMAAAKTSSPTVAGPAARAGGAFEEAAAFFTSGALEGAFDFVRTSVGGGGNWASSFLSGAGPVPLGKFVAGGDGVSTFVPTLCVPAAKA
jgi:hypothetical protein